MPTVLWGQEASDPSEVFYMTNSGSVPATEWASYRLTSWRYHCFYGYCDTIVPQFNVLKSQLKKKKEERQLLNFLETYNTHIPSHLYVVWKREREKRVRDRDGEKEWERESEREKKEIYNLYKFFGGYQWYLHVWSRVSAVVCYPLGK